MFHLAYIRDAGDVAVKTHDEIAGLAVGLSAFLTCVNAMVFLTVIMTLETHVAEMVETQNPDTLTRVLK